ncbi:MAG: glycoside hydrolase family 5 protein [Fibrobacter sp.]|nr:glycoside hydrolase family 5 protein [Fibrobacter sp.]
MKYSYLALAAMVSSFGLWACSSDSKPSQGSDDPSSSASIGGGETPTPVSSSSVIAVDDPDAKIPTVPNEAVATTNIAFSGFAAVGPMAKGATVSVTGVDPSTLATIGTAASGTVSSDLGEFSVQGSIGSAYAMISVTGSYYNYILDEKYGPVTLNALSKVGGRTVANVNVLTHVEAARVKQLVTVDGMTFNDAKVKAEKEIRLAFGLPSDSTSFEDITLYEFDQATSNLLAITTAVMGERKADVFQTILDYIRDDIAADGKWDDETFKISLADEIYALPLEPAISMLMGYTTKDLVGCGSEVSNFWGVQYGLGFCSEEGALAQNTNAKSVNNGKYFTCLSGTWGEASESYLEGLAMAEVFGACTADKEGTLNEGNGKTFICKKNFWVVASEEEIANGKIALTSGACDDTKYGKLQSYNSATYVCVPPMWTKTTHKAVDYSKGRAMNKILGKGMNFGNSWDAPSADDCGWSNCISDGDFAVVKNAGFNSVRIPVRWYTGVDSKLQGVKADVDLAIAQGLAVIINYHHYETMHEAAKSYPGGNYPSEKQNYLSVWKRVAQTFSSYPSNKLVFEIYNEPRGISQAAVDDLMLSAYEVIRAAAPNHTIMFEGNDYAKFSQVSKVTLPEDGNIIFTGHYYEPYSFSHQGHGEENGCKGDASYRNTAAADMKSYVDKAMIAYPDINGGHVPLNMGEFGIAKNCGITDGKRTQWTKLTVQAAETYNMSWHYWCFKNCGAFEAYNGSWMSGFLDAFGL